MTDTVYGAKPHIECEKKTLKAFRTLSAAKEYVESEVDGRDGVADAYWQRLAWKPTWSYRVADGPITVAGVVREYETSEGFDDD